MAPNIYFEASFGGIPLLLASISTEAGRDIVVQSPSRGDRHVLQDRGLRFGPTHCEVLFIDQPGLAPFLDRYEQFRDLVNAGEAEVFSHPLDGSYRARGAELGIAADSGTGEVRVTCSFYPEHEPQTVFTPGAGIAPAAGLEAVTTAAELTDTALANVGLENPIGSLCLDAVEAWTESLDLDSQDVFLTVANLTGQISDAIAALDLATDINRWPAYQAMIGLSFQVQSAAAAVTADSARVFTLVVARDLPLRAICAEVYPIEVIEDAATKVVQINRIRNPGFVRAGTKLKMPAVDGF